MTSGRDLLEGLAHLTGIRNAQRLECSLLKTLDGIYESAHIWAIALDAEGRPKSLHSFDRKHDAVTTIPFDRTHQPLPDGLLEQALQTGEAVADIDDAGRRVSVFPMSGLNEFSICLAFAFEGEEASESLDGLLVRASSPCIAISCA